MASYIKIKRVESTCNRIAMAVDGNWTPEEWEDIEEVERRIEKLRKEVEGRSEEDNVLESKTTQDHHLLHSLARGSRL